MMSRFVMLMNMWLKGYDLSIPGGSSILIWNIFARRTGMMRQTDWNSDTGNFADLSLKINRGDAVQGALWTLRTTLPVGLQDPLE